jgi:hypothetical protein
MVTAWAFAAGLLDRLCGVSPAAVTVSAFTVMVTAGAFIADLGDGGLGEGQDWQGEKYDADYWFEHVGNPQWLNDDGTGVARASPRGVVTGMKRRRVDTYSNGGYITVS